MSGNVRRVWPHTLWAGAETGDVAAGLERGLGYVGAVEGFQAVTGRIGEGDQPGHAALVGQRCGFAFHSNAGAVETGGEQIKRRGVGDFPAEDLGAGFDGAVDEQALFAVVHAERAH